MVVEVAGTVEVEGIVVDVSVVELAVVGVPVVVAPVVAGVVAAARRWPAEPPQAAVAATSPSVATITAPFRGRRDEASEMGLAPITAKPYRGGASRTGQWATTAERRRASVIPTTWHLSVFGS